MVHLLVLRDCIANSHHLREFLGVSERNWSIPQGSKRSPPAGFLTLY